MSITIHIHYFEELGYFLEQKDKLKNDSNNSRSFALLFLGEWHNRSNALSDSRLDGMPVLLIKRDFVL